MHLYGLLYVDENDVSVNVRIRQQSARLAMYVANAVNLARSLRHFGHGFTLLTNTALDRYAPGLLQAHGLQVRQIEFSTEVPRNIPFYSAHFKLDALRHMAAQAHEDYALLLDLDIECVRAFPAAAELVTQSGLPLVYDITDQVRPAYGETRIAADLALIAGRPLPPCWYGGELLGGTPAFLARLNAVVEELWPRYVKDHASLHHQGDEMLVSAALGLLRLEGAPLYDAGQLGLVTRWWSQQPRHPQLRFADAASDATLLHLPQDKLHLARRGQAAGTSYGLADFARSYRRVRWLQTAKKRAKTLIGRP